MPITTSGKHQLDTADFYSERNSDREKTAFLNIARQYTLGDMFSGELKLGGKYRHKSRFKTSSSLMAPYYLSYFQDYTRAADGSVGAEEFPGDAICQNLQMVGRLVLFNNFLDEPPLQRSVFDKYNLYPLVNRDALREWYELNKNGVGPTGQSEYNDNPEVRADYYDIVERVSAAYAMNTLNFGPLATLIAGVRVESETNDYAAKYVNTPLGGFPDHRKTS